MEGRRVLLTHSEGRLEGLAPSLEAQGFGVTHHPLVRTEFLPKVEVLEVGGAADLLGCDWLLFTSRTAVQAWAALGLPLGGTPKLGVVGAATALELARRGVKAALTAEPANARGLLETFRAHVSPPARVGLPCGKQALPTLQVGLTGAGFAVSKVDLYRTVPQPLSDIHPDINADIIVLTSPSAVSALPDGLGEQTRLVALGPSTRLAAEKRGWHVTQAQTPDVSGVVRALRAAFPAPSRILETP